MSYDDDYRVRAGQRHDNRKPDALDESRMLATWTLYVECDDDDDAGEREVTLPIRYAVCSICDGKGKHVNPSIDAGGITASEWADEWDQDEREGYLSGRYDVPCYGCGGRRVEWEIERKGLSEAQQADLKLLENHWDDCAQVDAEIAAERRAGC